MCSERVIIFAYRLVWERRNELLSAPAEAQENSEHLLPFVPYNLLTQHSIPDKSLADCVEALIGAYLIACGPRGALLFMSWLGIRVLPRADIKEPKAKVRFVKFLSLTVYSIYEMVMS